MTTLNDTPPPFIIYGDNDASKKTFEQRWQVEPPAAATNRLFIGGQSPMMVWGQTHNAITSALKSARSVIVFDFAPCEQALVDTGTLATLLPNKRAFYANRGTHCPANVRLNRLISKQQLIYWSPDSREVSHQTACFEYLVASLLRQLPTTSSAEKVVLVIHGLPHCETSDKRLKKAIDTLIYSHINLCMATTCDYTELKRDIDYHGFTQLLCKPSEPVTPSLRVSDSPAISFLKRPGDVTWRPCTFPTPDFRIETSIRPFNALTYPA